MALAVSLPIRKFRRRGLFEPLHRWLSTLNGEANSKRVAKPKWFDNEPLSFACVACGKCCRGPTNVFINEAEATAISMELGMQKFEFMKEYTEERDTQDGILVSLKSKQTQEECVFLDGRKCRIYNVRPVGCRTYPYWPSIMMGKAEWATEASRCEGINLNLATSSADIIPRKTIIDNLVIGEVHKKGLGPNWEYDDAVDYLAEATVTDSSLVEGFEEEFFANHQSRILFENSVLRVVDSTIPANPTNGNSVDDELLNESLETELITRRRMEFKSCLHMTQSEATVKVDSTGSDTVDFDDLSLPVHVVMAGMIKRQLLDINLANKMRLPTTVRGAVIGAGGCLLPMHIIHIWPSILNDNKSKCVIDAVDNNQSVLDVAEKYFGAKYQGSHQGSAYIVPVCADGATYLTANSENKSYNFVVIDTFESKSDGENSVDRAPAEVTAAIPMLTSAIKLIIGSNTEALCGHGLLLINALGSSEWIDHVVLNVSEAVKEVRASQNVGPSTNSDVNIAITIIRVIGSSNRVICVSTHKLLEAVSEQGNSKPSVSTETHSTRASPQDQDEESGNAVNDWGELLGVPPESAIVEDCMFV